MSSNQKSPVKWQQLFTTSTLLELAAWDWVNNSKKCYQKFYGSEKLQPKIVCKIFWLIFSESQAVKSESYILFLLKKHYRSYCMHLEGVLLLLIWQNFLLHSETRSEIRSGVLFCIVDLLIRGRNFYFCWKRKRLESWIWDFKKDRPAERSECLWNSSTNSQSKIAKALSPCTNCN